MTTESFLNALKSGEIGGYQNLINEVHASALAENERRSMPNMATNPPTFLDGQRFETETRGYAEGVVTVKASKAQVYWACSRLGQYVDGRRGDHTFRAYVYAVNATAVEGHTITVVVEPA